MTLIDKDKLMKELGICVCGCELCEWSKDGWNCTRGFQFASACESICEAREIDEEEVVANYCKKRNLSIMTNEMLHEIIRKYDASVGIVRCRDCQFNYSNQIPCDGPACQKFIDLPIREDFFCAYGERTEKRCD